ncbi:hypothetical protein KAI92_00255 [Candidatus Parcubacteria bacterium]|nr:hypothetical protein [Candidatus Parcubacteria bacterium]
MKYLIITILSLSILLTGCKKEEPIINNIDDNKPKISDNNTIKQQDTVKASSTIENENQDIEDKIIDIKIEESKEITPNEYKTKLDISDWKTYKNKELGYSVKYPKEWNVFIDKDSGKTWNDYRYWDEDNNLISAIDIKNTAKDVHTSCTLGGPFPPKEGMSFRIVIYKKKEKTFNSIMEVCHESSETGECEARFVMKDDNKFLVIDDTNKSCGKYPDAYIIKNNKMYHFDVVWNNMSEKRDYYKKLFYIILENIEIE